MDRTPILRCPTDGEPLLERPHGESHYHQCTGCQGIWVSRMFLQGLVQKADEKGARPEHFPAQTYESPAGCPACGKTMLHREEKGIQIDLCPTCRHIWLDGGEILHIAAASQAEIRPSLPGIARSAAEELGEAGVSGAIELAGEAAIRIALEAAAEAIGSVLD